jgi:hypothetical protein
MVIAYVYDKGIPDDGVFESHGIVLITPSKRIHKQAAVATDKVKRNTAISKARILVSGRTKVITEMQSFPPSFLCRSSALLGDFKRMLRLVGSANRAAVHWTSTKHASRFF